MKFASRTKAGKGFGEIRRESEQEAAEWAQCLTQGKARERDGESGQAGDGATVLHILSDGYLRRTHGCFWHEMSRAGIALGKSAVRVEGLCAGRSQMVSG